MAVIDYTKIDVRWAMRLALHRYVEHSEQAGDFLMALLRGDLFDAIERADDDNRHKLWEYACWLYNHAPFDCYRTPERVKSWLAREPLRSESIEDCDVCQWLIEQRGDRLVATLKGENVSVTAIGFEEDLKMEEHDR